MAVLKKHSTWSGVDIHVDGNGTFYAKVDDLEISDGLLLSVREKIDRALKPTAKKPKLALPVIVITDDRAIPTTLTGVSRANRAMEFSPVVKLRYSGDKVIADTPDNRTLAESLLAARRACDAAEESVARRNIEARGYGRVEVEAYQTLIDSLSAAHEKSAATKAAK